MPLSATSQGEAYDPERKDTSPAVAALTEWVWLCLHAARFLHEIITGRTRCERRLHPVVAPMVVERLARLAKGFARLIELLRAGVPPLPPVARPPRSGGSSPRAGRLYPVRMDETGLPGGGEVFANGVKLLLADDAIADLVATDPRAQRLLQSACAVFGVRMHQFLRPRPPAPEYATPASVSFVVPDDPVELQRLMQAAGLGGWLAENAG